MDDLQALVDDIHREIAKHTERGKVADYIPQLAAVDPAQFGIAVAASAGFASVVDRYVDPYFRRRRAALH